ncbi:MAG: LysR family transcriptional regulator [Thermoleophilaceae bacterium]|nr:LysR family transcriptional regulator [Thermoleophilaceae bacterium]
MLDVRRMKVLREVATRGSFSAAAEALNFTQSAVSQHIAALEREAGTQLVDRGSRGVRLTEAGRVLVDHADAILARIDCAEEDLAAIAGLRGGRLRLTCFQSAGATLAPRAVAAFHERHPRVELGMVVAEPDEAADRLRAGEADVAIVYDHESTPGLLPPELELTELIDDRYDVIVPSGHPLADRRRLSLADFAEEPWIASTRGCGCRRVTDTVCREAGFEPRVAFEADETLAAQALVAAGVGVTMLPRLALTSIHPGVVPRPLRDAPVRKVLAARTAGAYRSPASTAMVQILQDVSEDFRGTRLALAAS